MEQASNLTKFDRLQKLGITSEELPDVIAEQFDIFIEADRRIIEANAKSAYAAEMAERLKSGKSGVASKLPLPPGVPLPGVNSTENTTQDTIRSLADAQVALSDAQKILFASQKKMADGMRYLLMLGATNISMTRIVIAELEARLKRATEEQLSQKAREELKNVIGLLRDQEKLFTRQDRMMEQIESNHHNISAHEQTLRGLGETDSRHDREIEGISKKNEEQDCVLESAMEWNSEQDEELNRQRKIDVAHDQKLKKLTVGMWIAVGCSVAALLISVIQALSQGA